MKIRSKIIYGVLAVSGFLASCSESYLDRPALSEIMSNNFYQSADDLKKATAGLYAGEMWGQWSAECYLQFGDVMGGNMVLGYNDGAVQINNFSLNGLNSNLIGEWRSMYMLIGHCNTVIHAIEEVGSSDIQEADVNAAIGEAKFLRAYAYYRLVTLWREVPIIEDNRDLFSDPLINKNLAGDVYQFIVNDLVYASKNLPVTGANWEKGRVTKWSAQGLLSKVYLAWSGLDQNGTRSEALLDSAKLYAGNVCNNSGLALLSSYADVFQYEKSDNQESLFALQWSKTGGGWYGGNMLQLFSGALLINGNGGYFGIEVTYDMYLQYSEADSLRRKATFMYKGDSYPELNTNKGGLVFSNNSGLKKHIIGNEVDLNLPLMTNTASPEHTILLRLADIYLVYAEAILGNSSSTSDAQALQFFNAVRTRAGLDPVSSIDADMLRKERRIELAAEGDYWFDLVRLSYYNPSEALALLNGEQRVKILIDDEGVVTPGDPYGQLTPAEISSFRLPIPSSEITANPKLLDAAVPYF
jgi:hypothetical protein